MNGDFDRLTHHSKKSIKIMMIATLLHKLSIFEVPIYQLDLKKIKTMDRD